VLEGPPGVGHGHRDESWTWGRRGPSGPGHHCCQPVMGPLLHPGHHPGRRWPCTTPGEGRRRPRRRAGERSSPRPGKVAEGGRLQSPTARRTEIPPPREIAYPKAAAASPDQAADDPGGPTSKMLDDRRTPRSEYVLDLGGRLPHTFDLLKRGDDAGARVA